MRPYDFSTLTELYGHAAVVGKCGIGASDVDYRNGVGLSLYKNQHHEHDALMKRRISGSLEHVVRSHGAIGQLPSTSIVQHI